MTTTFESRGQAAGWLQGRLQKLEAAVLGGPERERQVAAVVRELIGDLEADAAQVAGTAAQRLRRALGKVTDDAFDAAEAGGFRKDALDRWAMDTLAKNLGTATTVFEAMAETLRDRMAQLSDEGNRAHDDGTGRFAEGLRNLESELRMSRAHQAPARPPSNGGLFGLFRRRAPEPEDTGRDDASRADASRVARGYAPDLEDALTEAAGGAARLAMARYYGAMLDRFEDFRAAAEALKDKARGIAEAASRRVTVPESVWDEPRAPKLDLLDARLLDGLLESLGIDTAAFLRHAELRPDELRSMTAARLEALVRDFVASRMQRLTTPELSDVLSGFQTGKAQVRQALVRAIARCQPLMHFNDQYHLHFDEGVPAQYFLMAEASDASLQAYLGDAASQIGFPEPRVDVVAQDGVSLRIMVLVAGVPFFAQIERLMEMVEIHAEVMREADGTLVTQDGLRAALRDSTESERLPSILPREVESAYRRMMAMRQNRPFDEVFAPEAPRPAADDEPAGDDEEEVTKIPRRVV